MNIGERVDLEEASGLAQRNSELHDAYTHVDSVMDNDIDISITPECKVKGDIYYGDTLGNSLI